MTVTRAPLKAVVWVGSSLDDLRACPGAIREAVGFALYVAQTGGRHPAAKRLKGDLRGLVEVVADDASGTYRTVYSAKRANTVYVLHVFQKKATRGIATPKHVRELIKTRLRWAERHARSAGEE